MVDISGPGAGRTVIFHHLGVACRDVRADRASLGALGYALEGDPFEDPAQGVRGEFLCGPGPRIELLEGLPGSTTLEPWLRSGVKVYHQAYVVDDVPEALAGVLAYGGRTLGSPVPAAAFGGRLIAFAVLRNLMVVEFVAR